MTRRKQGKPERPSKETGDTAVAALIANTLRVGRRLSLLEVARCVDVGRNAFGRTQALSEKVGISTEMLREFASVNKLSPSVKKLVRERKIESVDVAYRLSRLPPREQLAVARGVIAGRIDSNDVRAIVSLRRSAPDLGIGEIIERVKTSRNIKVYVAEFLLPSGKGRVESVREAFARVVGDKNISSVEVKGPVGTVRMNSEGKRRLQDVATREGLTKRQLIDHILDM